MWRGVRAYVFQLRRAKRGNNNEQQRNSKEALSLMRRAISRNPWAEQLLKILRGKTEGVSSRSAPPSTHYHPLPPSLFRSFATPGNNFTPFVFPRLLFTVAAGLTATL